MTTQDRIRAAGGIALDDGPVIFYTVEQFIAATQNAPAGWQPIETAPQNIAVDLWCKSTFNQAYGRRVTHVCLVGDNWFGANLPNPEFGEYAAHWMPLPAAPDTAHNITPATGTQEAA